MRYEPYGTNACLTAHIHHAVFDFLQLRDAQRSQMHNRAQIRCINDV